MIIVFHQEPLIFARNPTHLVLTKTPYRRTVNSFHEAWESLKFLSMYTPKETHIPKKESIGGFHKLSHTSLLIPAKSEQARETNHKGSLTTPMVLPKLHPGPITNIIKNMVRERRPTLTNTPFMFDSIFILAMSSLSISLLVTLGIIWVTCLKERHLSST